MIVKKEIKIQDKSYFYFDEGKGKVLILLHGWCDQSDDYINLVKELSKSFRIIVPDLPNFGASKTNQPFLINTYLTFLDDFIGLLKIKPTLIGHSFGGRLALEYIIRNKVYGTELILIDSNAVKLQKNILFFILSVVQNTLYELLSRNGLWFTSSIMKNWTKNIFSNMFRTDFWFMLHDILYTSVNNLQTLKCTSTILWGKNDYILTKNYARELKELIYNSKLIFITGGHFSCITNVQPFSEEIKKSVSVTS